MKREVRIQPNSYTGGGETRPLVKLGDVGAWSMVRRADMPTAAPFVISRKDWDKLPVQEEES